MRLSRSVRPRRLGISLVAAVAAAVLFGGTAYAHPIDDDVLAGAEGTRWDAQGNYTYDTGGGPCTGVDGTTQEVGYTPAADGSNNFSSDAFDGGLYLMVNGDAFGNGIENATITALGDQRNVGPQTKAGLVITRSDRALQSSPTLRSLVRFTNNGATKKTVNIVWDSAMGADNDEGTRASSSGDLVHGVGDRWIVASDDPSSATLEDPPILFVFFGKNAPRKVAAVVFAPEDPDPASGIGQGCVAVRYSLSVPAHSSRYMLFFTELGQSNEDAIAQAAKYNIRTLNAKLLVGISGTVKSRIVNWDLV
jgi:hypothetical protein